MMLLEWYPTIKAAHVGLVLLSGTVFAARGVGVLLGASAPMAAPVARLSQTIDTALLLTALTLLFTLRLNPFTMPWLQMKLTLLVGYIVLGTLALHRAPTRSGKIASFVAALACFGLMLIVATTHDPFGFLRIFGS